MKCFMWIAGLVLAFAGFASAQQVGDPTLTVAELEARIEELSSAEEVDSGAIENYRSAIAALQEVEASRALRERYATEAAESPALLPKLRAELEGMPSEPEIRAPADLELDALLEFLQEAEAELEAARARDSELQELSDHRAARRAEIPNELIAAQQSLGETSEALDATPAGSEFAVRRTLLSARALEFEARIAQLEAERGLFEAQRDVLPLRVDRARRQLAIAEKAAAFWRERAEARRELEGEVAVQQADERLNSVIAQFPLLEAPALRNRELADLRSGENGLPKRISRAREQLEEVRALSEDIDRRYRAARRRIKAGGLTEGMALILRHDFEALPREADLKADARARDEELSEAQLQSIAFEEERLQLLDIDAAAERLLDGLDAGGAESAAAPVTQVARELLAEQRDSLSALRAELSTLTGIYYEHKEIRAQYLERVASYRAFVKERILWVRSAATNVFEGAVAAPAAALAIAGSSRWAGILSELRDGLRERLPFGSLLGLLLVVLVAGRAFLRRKRAEMAGLVRSYRTDKFVYTVRAMVHTLLLVLPLPLVAWGMGSLLHGSTDELGRAVGSGLREIAAAWLVVRFLRGLVAEKGVGNAHFRWAAASTAAFRRELRWVEPLTLLPGFVTIVLDRQQTTEWSESLGRVCFVVAMLALALFAHRLTRAGSPLWSTAPASERGLLGRTHRLWSWIATATPLALGLMAAIGFYYTALQFELRLRYSIGFSIALVLINALLLRWLYINRRRLAVTQALEARARREKEEEAEEPSGVDTAAAALDADKVDIPAIDAQTRQLFKSSVTLAAVLGFYLIWASVLPALRGLDRVQLLPALQIVSADTDFASPAPAGSGDESSVSSPTGLPGAQALPATSGEEAVSAERTGLPQRLTLADVLLALIFLVLTHVAARNLPALLELSLLQRLPLDSGSRYAVSTIVRYLILLVGVSAVSGALGIGWQQIQWLAAALTFGLAFGLQEIFANFVSGLIILIERPIRVGDIVTVGSTEGRVTQLRMRATTVLDYDRREYLIPNKEFITGNVVNWTLSDPVTRVVIPVGIAYGSNVEKARSILLGIARGHRLVLEDPPPAALFRSFGDSTLDFELRVFMSNRDLWPVLIDELHSSIDAQFRDADIEIAFPQRDLHVRSAPGLEGLAARRDAPEA